MAQMTLIGRALERYREIYGVPPSMAYRAPARINILGEHVDYVRYLPTASLPFGSKEHEMIMLFSPTDDGRVRGASMNPSFSPFEFSLDEDLIRGESWEQSIFNRPAPAPHWSNYCKGAVFFAGWKFAAPVSRGFQFLVASTIPANSGASSSSALVTLTGAAIRRVNRIEIEMSDLAIESSQAEWYLGTRGGALDHTAICLAREGSLVYISHADQQAKLIPLDAADLRWATFFTTPAAKGSEVMLAYNERAAVSRILIPALIQQAGWASDEIPEKLNQLPVMMTLAEFERLAPADFAECKRAFPALVRERFLTPLKIRDRARHHFSESLRVDAAVRLATEAGAGGQSLAQGMGRLINESHASLRDLYDVSTPEVESLIEILRRAPDVYGARLMGGGFGGNILALTSAKNFLALIDLVQTQYYSPRGRSGAQEGSIMISTPGDGLRRIDL